MLVSLLIALLGCGTPTINETGDTATGPQIAPDAVGYFESLLENSAGPNIPLSVWYPAQDSADAELATYAFGAQASAKIDLEPATGPFPIILFSHGDSSSQWDGTFYKEAWARAGYLVVSPAHVGNTYLDHPSTEQTSEIFLRRPKDMGLAFRALVSWNQQADHRLFGHVDTERLIVAGHSAGGATALLTAGVGASRTTVKVACLNGLMPPDGEVCALADASTDPYIFLNPPDLPPVMGALLFAPMNAGLFDRSGLGYASMPTLVVAGADDEMTPPAQHSIPLYNNLSDKAALAMIANTGHSSFVAICHLDDLSQVPSLVPEECANNSLDQSELIDIIDVLSLNWLKIIDGSDSAIEPILAIGDSHDVTIQTSGF